MENHSANCAQKRIKGTRWAIFGAIFHCSTPRLTSDLVTLLNSQNCCCRGFCVHLLQKVIWLQISFAVLGQRCQLRKSWDVVGSVVTLEGMAYMFRESDFLKSSDVRHLRF